MEPDTTDLFSTPMRAMRGTPGSPLSPQPPAGPAKVSFFEKIGRDVEIVKTVLLLTGAFHGTSHQVCVWVLARAADVRWRVCCARILQPPDCPPVRLGPEAPSCLRGTAVRPAALGSPGRTIRFPGLLACLLAYWLGG